jgi:hypothetical protein
MKQTLLNKEIIALHQSVITPPGTRVGTCGWDTCEVWVRRLNTAGTDVLVALVNLGSLKREATVTWATFGWF